MKNKTTSKLLIFGLVAAFIFVPYNFKQKQSEPTANLHASDENLKVESSCISGTGTYFEITGSDYLNVRLISSETITIRLESIPELVNFLIEAEEYVVSSVITLEGLEPLKKYYRYEDGIYMDNFTADAKGSYTYLQDLSTLHHITIQEDASTLYLYTDYTFTRDIHDNIEVRNHGITIDGNGFTLRPGNRHHGIYINGFQGLTIKNLKIDNWFAYAIYMINSRDTSIENNVITNCEYGVFMIGCSLNRIVNNVIEGCLEGILLRSSSRNTFTDNSITTIFLETDIIFEGVSTNNLIYHNNFKSRIPNPVRGDTKRDNIWSHDQEGNYWWAYVYDIKGQDNDGDGIGDTELPALGLDGFPFMKENGWINLPPVAVDDVIETDEDVTIIIDVLFNDSDEDGDILTIDSVEGPSHGIALISGNEIEYTPDLDYNGSDSFDYTITDGRNGFDTATVNLTINPVNDAPVAVNDAVSVMEDQTITVHVLENDYDVEGDPLTVVYLTDPANGVITDNGDGTITFSPDSDFNGVSTFFYKIFDGIIESDQATVVITVLPVNDAPLAFDDTASIDEDNSLTIDVLANDIDIEGDTLSIESVETPSHGIALISGSYITYTPNLDFYGTDSFEYNITDGKNGFDTATVSLIINAVNDAPVAIDDTATTDEEISITIDVLENDYDVDGDTLTVDSVNLPDNGVAILSEDKVIYTPNQDFVGIDFFEYTLIDEKGGSDTAVCTITVLDKTPPETAYVLEGNLGENNWYVSNVNVSLLASDEFSEILQTEYSINEGVWTIYSSKFEIIDEGINTIRYRSIDIAGNEEDIKSVTIKIDKTAPSTELVITDGVVDDDGKIYATYDSNFVIAGYDIHSGIYYSLYRINAMDWIKFNEPFQLNGEPGEYIIEYYSVDLAGNVESVMSTSVILKPEFDEVYHGCGILCINGQGFCGEATLSLSEDTIQLEIGDQIVTWDVKCHCKLGSVEFYFGKGDLGKIAVIVVKSRCSSAVIAIGKGVFFIGRS